MKEPKEILNTRFHASAFVSDEVRMVLRLKILLVVCVFLLALVDCCEANGGETADSFLDYLISK